MRTIDELQPAAPLASVVSAPDAARYHHLDAVRGFALMLGVVFHAAESFGPNNHYWAVVDCSPSALLEWFRFGCHSFRLQLFFVIAGFFARLLVLRRGTAGFVRNRAGRILVPLVVGWAAVYPVLVYLWLWGWSISGKLPELGIPPEAQGLPLWKLVLGFFITGAFLKKFDLTHLWFLYQLLVLYAVMLAIRWAWLHADRTGAKMAWLDRRFTRLCCRTAWLWVLPLITIPILLSMHSWVVDTPKESLVPSLPVTLMYGLCFGIGWMLHRQPDLAREFGRRWVGAMIIGLALCVVLGTDLIPFRQLTRAQVHLAYATLYAMMMWAFVLGFLGLFTRLCRQPRPWVRYIADSSYWIYIVHIPLVVYLQVLLGRWPVIWPLKYPLILAISFPLLFLSYHYLVRNTWIGVQLNGHRYPRRWPWREGLMVQGPAERALDRSHG